MKFFTVPLIILFFVFPATASEEEDAGTSGVLKSALAKASFESAESFLQGGQGNTQERVEWQTRMDAAQDRRSRGIRYTFFGLGGVVAGSVIAVAAGPRYYYSDRGSSAASAVGVLVTLGGLGLSGYGIYNWIGGSDEVDRLDREGRANGWLSFIPIFIPTDGGVRLAMDFGF